MHLGSDISLTNDDGSVIAYSAYAIDDTERPSENNNPPPNARTASLSAQPEKENGPWHGRRNIILVSVILVVALAITALSLAYVFVWGKKSPLQPPPPNEDGLGTETDHVIHERPKNFDELAYVRYLLDVISEEYERRGDGISAALLNQPATPQRSALDWLAYKDTTVLEGPHQIVQRFALLLIYFSTGGANLWDRQWLVPGLHECYFEGIECEPDSGDEDGRSISVSESMKAYEDLQVVSLNLSERSLAGELPHDIALLSHLRKLNLDNNRLQGSIPEELYQNEKLVELTLHSNSLIGSISENFYKLSSLERFTVHANLLTGLLPTRIPTALKEFKASFNDLSGPLDKFASNMDPKDLGSLESIDINSNTHISGTIPTYFGHFTNLKTLHLSVLDLNGTIPSEIGILPLEILGLGALGINGTIPVEIWKIPTLQAFFTDDSQRLGGSIPTEIGLMQSLMILSMRTTLTSGTIPTEIGLVTSLLWLEMPSTRVSGMIPSEMSRLTDLRKINLANTQLFGTVPPGICPQTFIMTCVDNNPVTCDCCTTCLKPGKGFV